MPHIGHNAWLIVGAQETFGEQIHDKAPEPAKEKDSLRLEQCGVVFPLQNPKRDL